MSSPMDYPGSVISTILRHDAKTASYKIALLRAISDVALAFPDVGRDALPVAVPLSALAEFWIAYFWPFVDSTCPILQGRRSQRAAGQSSDMAFRVPLTALRLAWEFELGTRSLPSDGYLVVNELRSARKRALYRPNLVTAYDQAVAAIANTIQMPIRYAGPGTWSVFPRPCRFGQLPCPAAPLPNTRPADLCLLVSASLWRDFQQLSLWVEALCIHEWSLFTESLSLPGAQAVTRGQVYQLLTDRPNNRRPLTWERNQVDILLLEGCQFQCPWTEKRITTTDYDLDHIIPVAVYPVNELWNLVPSESTFNQHHKRDRLPTAIRLAAAGPILQRTYDTYLLSSALARALREDVIARFVDVPADRADFTQALTAATVSFTARVADARNLARF